MDAASIKALLDGISEILGLVGVLLICYWLIKG